MYYFIVQVVRSNSNLYSLLQICIIFFLYSFSLPISTTRIWLDDLRCLGTESKLIYCRANPIGVEDCSHTQDVALYCTGSKSQYYNYMHGMHGWDFLAHEIQLAQFLNDTIAL